MTHTATPAAVAFEQQTRALNQLASLLVGRDAAIATNELSHDPIARIEELLDRASTELRRAAGAGDQGTLKGAARRAEGLGSLLILAKGLVAV